MLICKIYDRDRKFVDFALLNNRQHNLNAIMRAHGNALYQIDIFDVEVLEISPGAIFEDETIEDYLEVGDDGDFLYVKKSELKEPGIRMWISYRTKGGATE